MSVSKMLRSLVAVARLNQTPKFGGLKTPWLVFRRTCSRESKKKFEADERLDLLRDRLKNDKNLQAELPSTVIGLCEHRERLLDDITALSQFGDCEDSELKSMMKSEQAEYDKQLKALESQIIEGIAHHLSIPKHDSFIMEITAGVGGQEAMLFAKDLFIMYENYLQFKQWNYCIAEVDTSPLGGIRHASILIDGIEAAHCLEYESGVHRVQRVPATEKSGRIHTSTATVAILPQPSEVDVKIDDKDIEITTKRSSGAGGQHVNTTDSAVRILHVPSGIIIDSQTDRSQIKNKELGMKRLRAKLYDLKLTELKTSLQTSRKSQVGSAGRSEKVRTLNYPQDRITDHRLSKSYHGVMPFLEGESLLDRVVGDLGDHYCEAKLKEFLNNFLTSLK